MEEEKFYTIILRHDDSTKWMINDPILALGEYGVEDDTHRIKRGDGNSKWSELQYEHFGLEYLITFNNLRGEVSDNIPLQNALDAKVDKKIFEDINNTVISGLLITTEEGKIGKITKTTKDVVNGTVKVSQLLIQSDDESIQGVWSIDAEGTEILNLRANAAIDDYEPKRKYAKDHICFYDNILYRAVENFEAGVVFNPEQWVKLASLHADDIRYDNKISGLESKTVKKALDELKDLTDEKLQMTRRPYKVYGTNEDGEQMLYDKDELRTVDSVNGIEADPETKNIQIDAKGINYDDAEQIKRSIKEVLDSKVDKNIAGEEDRIVKDVKIVYEEEHGVIEVVEEKLSLVDGTTETQTSKVDIASNVELDNTRNALITKITEVEQNANSKMESIYTNLDTKVNTVENTLLMRIEEDKTEINNRVDSEVLTLNTTISGEVSTLNDRIDNEVSTLNTVIDTNKADCDKALSDAQTILQTNIDTNKADIENKLTENVTNLNTTINTNKTEINERVDTEVSTLNETITTNKTEINAKVDANKADIENKLETGLHTKIDKDIADSIITGIGVSTEPGEKLDEPTLKIIAKNTDTETEIVKHIHFAEKGAINVTKENDHIVIDSSDIDLQVKVNKEGIAAHDLKINALQEHDMNHDTELALHASQIANHETRLLEAEADIIRIDKDIADLDSKIENETTNRKVEDAKLETDISRNALNIQANAEAIRENADNIIELNNVLQENVTNLANSKADKAFAKDTDNKVVGKVTLNTLEASEIADMTLTHVSPVDGASSTENIKLISSDNTLVSKAITDENGNIVGYDLATNLDTDVNYWITTEIISTTIPSETVLDITKLTSTTKSPIELQDIVSDPEGTWARVQEIDNEANTVTVVTFHKHAQAVWGTVKGDITDQKDLQEALDLKIDESIASSLITGVRISDSGSNRDNLDHIKFNWDVKPTNGNGGHTAQGGIFAKSDSILLTKGQGTNPTTYKFKVEAEGVEFKPEESGLTSTLLAPAIRELKTISDTHLAEFETFKTDTTTALAGKVDVLQGKELAYNLTSLYADSDYEVASYPFVLMRYINKDSLFRGTAFGSYNQDITFEDRGNKGSRGNEFHLFSLGVNAENILIDTTDTNLTETKLAPIVREISNKVDVKAETVNGIGIDENNNITITGEDIDVSLDLQGLTLAQLIKEILATVQSGMLEYTQGREYFVNSEHNEANFVFHTHKASGVTLMGRVMKDFAADTVANSEYESFKIDVMNGNISLVGIPEQIEEGTVVDNTITGIIPGTLINGLWVDETSTAEFEARDRDGNIIAYKTLKATDVTEVEFADMQCGSFNLDLQNGATVDTAKETIYDLRISATYEGETMSQTFQFAYDIDNDIYFADQWPA